MCWASSIWDLNVAQWKNVITDDVSNKSIFVITHTSSKPLPCRDYTWRCMEFVSILDLRIIITDSDSNYPSVLYLSHATVNLKYSVSMDLIEDLIWWVASLPTAGGLELDEFKVPSNQCYYVIVWIIPLLAFISTSCFYLWETWRVISNIHFWMAGTLQSSTAFYSSANNFVTLIWVIKTTTVMLNVAEK